MSKIRKMVLFLVQYFLYTLYTSPRFHVPHYWIWTSKEDAKNCQNTSTASVTSVHYISLCQIFTQKSFGCRAIFYSPLHFCSFERTWPSWIIRYSWFCCPCMRCEMSVHQKNGGELMNIRCDFFHPIPSSSCSTCGQFVRNSEMPLATLNFLETKITWKDCYLKWKKCQQIRSPILKG